MLTRIEGGSEVVPHSIPWQVALVPIGGRKSFCGGTLIGSWHVLSAAHCTVNETSFQVVVGEHDLENDIYGTVIDVEGTYEHPGYDYLDTHNYDFSIIRLKEKVDLGFKAIHACLPNKNMTDDYFEGKKFTVSGWGNLKYNTQETSILQSVELPFVNSKVCQDKWNQTVITAEMLCAGNVKDGGVGACNGDSGGT